MDQRAITQDKSGQFSFHQPHLQWSDFKRNADGMVPVIVQEEGSKDVLMLAYMNEEAFLKTVETGLMTYWSRSRNELWTKGLTSGHRQEVVSLIADCDYDTILATVHQIGGIACHTGAHSCFHNPIVSADGLEQKSVDQENL